LLVKGAPGSPYTRKLVGLLRYRRIPYRLLHGDQADRLGLPKPAVELLPTAYFADAQGQWQAVTDSTPLIRRLESNHSGNSAIPTSPAMAFLNSLLEDFADEWLTKAMFHYRWSKAPDIHKASQLLPLHYKGVGMPQVELEVHGQLFSRRQISRLAVVGSTAATAPLIEAAYERLVVLLDRHFVSTPYLMGHRPGSADFALYGQLTQLAHWEPTSMALTLRLSPRVFAWVGLMDDLSGLDASEEQWLSLQALPDSLLALLKEVARGYVPVMLANAEAVMHASPTLSTDIDGQAWVQKTVNYQAKCLQWLREEYAALSPGEQSSVMNVLQDTGCATLIQASLRRDA
jgi:glutathione S-transferase